MSAKGEYLRTLGRGECFGVELMTNDISRRQVQAISSCTLYVLLKVRALGQPHGTTRHTTRPTPHLPTGLSRLDWLVYALQDDLNKFVLNFPDLFDEVVRSQRKVRALRRVNRPSVKLTKLAEKGLDMLATAATGKSLNTDFVRLPDKYDGSKVCIHTQIRLPAIAPRTSSSRVRCASPLPHSSRRACSTSCYFVPNISSSSGKTKGDSSDGRTCPSRPSTRKASPSAR